MKRMEYLVSNVKTPRSERVCRNLSEVSALIGACRSVVQRRLVKGYCTINDWKIVKRFTAETEKPKHDRGVVVFTKDGRTLSFRSKKDCARIMGISSAVIEEKQNAGTADKDGNFYDWPLEED